MEDRVAFIVKCSEAAEKRLEEEAKVAAELASKKRAEAAEKLLQQTEMMAQTLQDGSKTWAKNVLGNIHSSASDLVGSVFG